MPRMEDIQRDGGPLEPIPAPAPKVCLSGPGSYRRHKLQFFDVMTRALPQGDLTKFDDLKKAFKGIDSVWHIGALVGPYHAYEMYEKVNYEGTLNVVKACRELKIRKLVYSSSPGTRFDGSDIEGRTEAELDFPEVYLQPYAETKAMGERAALAACDGDSLLVTAVAPHQVYGPRDQLFLANFLKAGKKLRVFGKGRNKISTCYVDNYCHGLILGEQALYPGSPALGKFYIVTDGEPVFFWDMIDHALTECGYTSIKKRFALPTWFMMGLAYVSLALGALLGKKFRLNPFAVKMMVIHRWFNIDAARKDLGYEPLVTFEEAFAKTITWYKESWIPEHMPELG